MKGWHPANVLRARKDPPESSSRGNNVLEDHPRSPWWRKKCAVTISSGHESQGRRRRAGVWVRWTARGGGGDGANFRTFGGSPRRMCGAEPRTRTTPEVGAAARACKWTWSWVTAQLRMARSSRLQPSNQRPAARLGWPHSRARAPRRSRGCHRNQDVAFYV